MTTTGFLPGSKINSHKKKEHIDPKQLDITMNDAIKRFEEKLKL